MEKNMEHEMDTRVVKGLYRDSSIQQIHMGIGLNSL